jgi:hypothetical protein
MFLCYASYIMNPKHADLTETKYSLRVEEFVRGIPISNSTGNPR